jgi:hypothetical protein
VGADHLVDGTIRIVSKADRTPTTKFRYNVSIAIAGILALFGAIPLATSGFGGDGQPWYAYPLLIILIIPIAAIVWGWRAGTDANAAGVLVRPLGLRAHPIAWTDIVGIVPQGRKVFAALADDRAIPLPAVARGDIPGLVAASGQQISTDDVDRAIEPVDQ